MPVPRESEQSSCWCRAGVAYLFFDIGERHGLENIVSVPNSWLMLPPPLLSDTTDALESAASIAVGCLVAGCGLPQMTAVAEALKQQQPLLSNTGLTGEDSEVIVFAYSFVVFQLRIRSG